VARSGRDVARCHSAKSLWSKLASLRLVRTGSLLLEHNLGDIIARRSDAWILPYPRHLRLILARLKLRVDASPMFELVEFVFVESIDRYRLRVHEKYDASLNSTSYFVFFIYLGKASHNMAVTSVL
jgi:hypothetical protein